MPGKLTDWEDTIVAVATPPGVGAIGVIRVSGSKTFAIVDNLFPAKNLREQASHTMHVGLLKEGDETLDEAVVMLFRGPRSYTGEDVIEISCHGSPYILERVVRALVQGGARLARAGEFTQRAFLNGRLDLAQAEAVADVIASNTAASARTALHTMRGGFSRELRELRERLISFSALIELELDFSQEDVEFADRTALYRLIGEAESMTAALLASFRLGNVIRNGVSVAIVGKPNAGKSTLLNALLNENRAIVSEIAGTTRDTIEEVLNIDGVLFRLIDTAGIREHTPDTIERIGVGRSLEKMEQADIVVYLFDASSEDAAFVAGVRDELTAKGKTFLLVGNKVDALRGRLVGDGSAEKGLGEGGLAAAAEFVPGGLVDEGLMGGEMLGEDLAGHGLRGTGPSGGELAERRDSGEGHSGNELRRTRPSGGDLTERRVSGEGLAANELRRDGPSSGGLMEDRSSGEGITGNELTGGEPSGEGLPGGGLADAELRGDQAARSRFASELLISAKESKQVDVLKQRLVDLVLQGAAAGEGTIVTNARHYHALQQVAESLTTIRRGLDELLPGDLLALDIRHCLHWLGEITGEITTEDRLDYIFSKFCIGK